MRPLIQKVNIAEGFTQDCDELIQRCLQTESLNYHVFCNLWKDMKFADVFLGRTHNTEIGELSEELVLIAKHYMVANTQNFEESVAGLFILYGIVNLQTYPRFAPVRITPNDLDAIQAIEDEARKQRRVDVLYILGSLLIEGPVQYHLTEREYGMEVRLRKNFEDATPLDRVGIRSTSVFQRHPEELGIIRELSSLGRRYTNAKTLIHGDDKPDRNLQYVDDHLANELSASLKQVISRTSVLDTTELSATIDMIESIKQKAMSGKGKKMRHLTSIYDSEMGEPSRRGRKKKPKQTKAKSPKKNVIKSPKTVAKNKPKKRRRKTYSDESSSDDFDIDFQGSDDDDDDEFFVSSDEDEYNSNIPIMSSKEKAKTSDLNIDSVTVGKNLPVLEDADKSEPLGSVSNDPTKNGNESKVPELSAEPEIKKMKGTRRSPRKI